MMNVCTLQNYAFIFVLFAIGTALPVTLIMGELDSRRFRRKLEKDALGFTAALKEIAKEDLKKKKKK